MKPQDLALIVALGVAATASTANGAELCTYDGIRKVEEETVQPTCGHTTRYETYEIIAREGDTVQSVVDRLNACGLRNNYLSAPGGQNVSVEGLVHQNPLLKQSEIEAGWVIEYTRVSVQFTGIHILG